ncbi:MAG TPA: restriction endonuclease [Methanothrix sp.]|nr:restriction endonuclease [Methanothrix sp.]
MAQNMGETHERLILQILDQILSENAHNIKVNHNILLEGKDATHQIDIYWEFQVGDKKYSAVVEVKALSKPVGQETLFQFRSVLDDLPEQPIGILVSNTGYQEVAREYAKKRGILLYELREASEADWNDRIKRFDIDISAYTPHFDNIKLIQDIEWNIQELKRLNIPPSEASKIRVEVSDNLKFYDENDKEITTALVLFNSLVPKGLDELPPTKVVYTFDKSTFIKTSNPQVKMKLKSIEVTISKIHTTKKIQIKGEDFVDYVLKNIAEDTIGTCSRGD